MKDSQAGFEEVEHTADWQLHVWAPDLPGLFEQAARGMYTLAGMRLAGETTPRLERRLEISAPDPESLLVRFLSELLHICQEENQGFDAFHLGLEKNDLKAHLSGAPILTVGKEIKAVTYHNLIIEATERGVETTIVFDV
jgi:SHS2 domain-containing protein